MVIGPYTAHGQIQGISVDVSVDRGDFEAEHHTLVIDGLIRFQQLVHGLMDGFRNPPFDDMAYTDIRAVYSFAPEEGTGRLMDRLDKGRMGDGHLVVLGEYGGDTVVLKMREADFLSIGLDKGAGIETLSMGVIIRGGCSKIPGKGLHNAELSNGLQSECRFHRSGGFEVVR